MLEGAGELTHRPILGQSIHRVIRCDLDPLPHAPAISEQVITLSFAGFTQAPRGDFAVVGAADELESDVQVFHVGPSSNDVQVVRLILSGLPQAVKLSG